MVRLVQPLSRRIPLGRWFHEAEPLTRVRLSRRQASARSTVSSGLDQWGSADRGSSGHSSTISIPHSARGSVTTEKARIVIGADGKNSLVARSVKAETYNVIASRTCG